MNHIRVNWRITHPSVWSLQVSGHVIGTLTRYGHVALDLPYVWSMWEENKLVHDFFVCSVLDSMTY